MKALVQHWKKDSGSHLLINAKNRSESSVAGSRVRKFSAKSPPETNWFWNHMVGMSNYRMLRASGRIFCTVLFNHHFGTSQLDEKRAPLRNPCKNSNSVSRTQITQVMCDQEPFCMARQQNAKLLAIQNGCIWWRSNAAGSDASSGLDP